MSRRRPTPAVRRGAILICAIAASNWDLVQSYANVFYALNGEMSMHEAMKDGCLCLALSAWSECEYAWQDGNPDAEAESLLRSGWCPGERTMKLR